MYILFVLKRGRSRCRLCHLFSILRLAIRAVLVLREDVVGTVTKEMVTLGVGAHVALLEVAVELVVLLGNLRRSDVCLDGEGEGYADGKAIHYIIYSAPTTQKTGQHGSHRDDTRCGT